MMKLQSILSQNTSYKNKIVSTPIIAPHGKSTNQIAPAALLTGRLAAASVPPGGT